MCACLLAACGDGPDRCGSDKDCGPDARCLDPAEVWCGQGDAPAGKRCVADGACASDEDCLSGQWCRCAGEAETCCHEGWPSGFCRACESDDHCGPQCLDCANQQTNRVCVNGTCGCLDQNDCTPGEVCERHVCRRPEHEIDCQDGIDDDADGLTDCEDVDDCACPRVLRPLTMLGDGGFFGISACTLGTAAGSPAGSYAIGAHYAESDAACGEDCQTGRVYVFHHGEPPQDAGDAALALQPDDGAKWGGFGYALSSPCDFDADGHPDLAVGSHLYSEGTTAAVGRVVTFAGQPGGLSSDPGGYHMLSADLRAARDAMGQTVLCADFDGDGFDDLLATGQNAGAADTGLGAVFPGGPGGLPATQEFIIEPSVLANRQYLGAASLYEDLDGDGARDLALGGWGLIKGGTADGPHTGGVAVYPGGTDWTAGPAFQLVPEEDDEIQLGVEMTLVETSGARYLAVGAADYGDPVSGAVFVWECGREDFAAVPPLQVLTPPEEFIDTGFGSSLAWVPDYFGQGRGALLCGMKWADASADEHGTGAVAVFAPRQDGPGFATDCGLLLAPEPLPNDSFGGNITALDDIDGDGLRDFLVGIDSHVEGDLTTGVQTGGVILYQ